MTPHAARHGRLRKPEGVVSEKQMFDNGKSVSPSNFLTQEPSALQTDPRAQRDLLVSVMAHLGDMESIHPMKPKKGNPACIVLNLFA